MNNNIELLNNALDSIRKFTDFKPEIGIVLGSGLGEFARNVKEECSISYKDICDFPVSTNKMHKGRFVFGNNRSYFYICSITFDWSKL